MSFINLKDCPASYSGTAGKIVTSSGAGLTFRSASFTTPTDSSVIPKQAAIGVDMQFKLVNDALTPGANKYYGTNSTGLKGWYDLPGA
jgi:hypothetical protein